MNNKESKENCVFCKILSGEFQCSEIYRDNEVAAFLDIQPINPGHVLVIPVKHTPYLENLDSDIGAKVFVVAQKISKAIRKSNIKSTGVNLFLADGEDAGQEVWHTHLHIFPRFANDGFGLKHSKEYFNKPSREELDHVAGLIREQLN